MALIGSAEVAAAGMAATGQTVYVMQGAQDPGVVVAMTVWADKASGQAFFQGPAYARLAQQMRPYLIAPPEPMTFEIEAMYQAYGGEMLRHPQAINIGELGTLAHAAAQFPARPLPDSNL
jgi:quinol monooxygenase YgiN